MSITIDLPADVEARLTARAGELGVPLAEYIGRLLIEHFPAEPQLSLEERLRLLHEIPKEFADAPLLSDEAISRESIYGSRG